MLCKPLNDHLFFFFSEIFWEPIKRRKRDDFALQILFIFVYISPDFMIKNFFMSRSQGNCGCSAFLILPVFVPKWTLKAQSACMDKYLLSSQDEKAIGYRFYPSLHCHLEIKFLSNPWIVVLAMISPFPPRMATLPNDLYTVSFTDHLGVWGRFFFDMDDLANLVNEEKIRLNNDGMLN